MVTIGLVGCEGKLASDILKNIEKSETCILKHAIARAGSIRVGKSVSLFAAYSKNSVIVSDDVMLCEDCDIIIDATSRNSFMELNYDKYLQLKKPLIIATTGFTIKDMEKINVLAKDMPILKEANYSAELFYFIAAIKEFVRYSRVTDVAIIEEHHRQKKDAPSGTSILIKNEICDINPDLNVEIVSVRAGVICGEHRVVFATNDGEEITFVHKATSRNVFAAGIIKMVSRVVKLKNGLYGMRDVLYLKSNTANEVDK